MTVTSILFEPVDGVARITLNRPDVLNSFDKAMAARLQEVLAQVADDASLRARREIEWMVGHDNFCAVARHVLESSS